MRFDGCKWMLVYTNKSLSSHDKEEGKCSVMFSTLGINNDDEAVKEMVSFPVVKQNYFFLDLKNRLKSHREHQVS